MTLVVGPEVSALEVLRRVPDRFPEGKGLVVVAWARKTGVGLLADALGDLIERVEVIVGLSNQGTSAEALAYLEMLAGCVYTFHKHPSQTFHPKIYLFEDGLEPPEAADLLVGSSNLTGGGLVQNIEASILLELRPSQEQADFEIYRSVIEQAQAVIDSPYCEELADNEQIQELLRAGLVSTELRLRRRRAVTRPRGNLTSKHHRTQAPPPPLPTVVLPELATDFAEPDEVREGPPMTESEGAVSHALPPEEQFYVRTPTGNDVNKLLGHTPGTAEWDIGETARDAMPGFWGWPDEYEPVMRTVERLEWATRGLLRSSETPLEGVAVDVVLWHREARPGHAAEHRLRIGPRATLSQATPAGFDTDCLIVVERLSAPGGAIPFHVRLLAPTDPEYSDYAKYLTTERPQHRFGYGP